MAKKRAKKKAVKRSGRKKPNLFSLASKSAGFKAAKKAETKAAARKKAAWKKAVAAAKRKLKSYK